MDLKHRANQLKTDIPAIFLCLKSRETPLPAKIFAALTVAYALSPIDLIPDFIPLLGYLDDLIILPALAALTLRLIPKEILARCRRQAEGMWADGRPTRWYYAVPIVLVWLLALWMVAKAIIF